MARMPLQLLGTCPGLAVVAPPLPGVGLGNFVEAVAVSRGPRTAGQWPPVRVLLLLGSLPGLAPWAGPARPPSLRGGALAPLGLAPPVYLPSSWKRASHCPLTLPSECPKALHEQWQSKAGGRGFQGSLPCEAHRAPLLPDSPIRGQARAGPGIGAGPRQPQLLQLARVGALPPAPRGVDWSAPGCWAGPPLGHPAPGSLPRPAAQQQGPRRAWPGRASEF